MRILSITGGAGPMYCGSCFRDNALAAELIAQGHDVTLLPVYTPTLTDEPNVSDERVFFGGLSVYLEQHVPLFRKTPKVMDRLWDAPPLIRALAGRSVATDPRLLGELTVSMLKGEEGFQRKEIAKLIDWLGSVPPFEVLNLPYSLLIALAAPLKHATGRPVCCTLQGEDLFLEGLPEPYRSQSLELIRRQVHSVDAFVAVSRYYADFMSRYLAIPRDKIEVVPLGINLQGHAPRSGARSGPFTIGYFARVAPEKGLDRLCEAYRILRLERGLPEASLEAAGYLGPQQRSYLEGIERRMREWGLEAEFHYRGALDRAGKIRFLQGLDVLSVPSPYVEPKGLYLLEAMANGVPVVQPRHGAFPEIVEKTGGGLLVEPNDPSSLAEGILRLARDKALAEELGRRGAEGVRRHYSAARMAQRALEVYPKLLAPPRAEPVAARAH